MLACIRQECLKLIPAHINAAMSGVAAGVCQACFKVLVPLHKQRPLLLLQSQLGRVNGPDFVNGITRGAALVMHEHEAVRLAANIGHAGNRAVVPLIFNIDMLWSGCLHGSDSGYWLKGACRVRLCLRKVQPRCGTMPAMLMYPHIDPVALQVGPLAVHWYGLTYLAAFGLFLFLGTRRLHHPPFRFMTSDRAWSRKDVEDILFLGVLGVVVGGRIGYCLFYKPGYYLSHPLEIFAVWQGGMSFHGGLLGVIVAMLWFARSRKRGMLEVADFVAPCVPTGLAAGRIGNFINGELWGRAASADLPWAMVFPQSGSMIPRHPSQIYQVLMEGLLLFIILWIYARKEHKPGQVASVFLLGYGVFRFVAEYFREPDDFLGILSLGMSMGQWLCIPMIVGGALLWWWCGKQAPYEVKRTAA